MFQVIYNFFESFAYIALAALGMSIIYGMTGIINMAHGEIMLIGAAICSYSTAYLGVPFGIGVIFAIVGSTVAGVILDRVVLARLYKRPDDSLVCTYGVSLMLIQASVILLGTAAPSITAPFSTVTIGTRAYSQYKFFIIIVALVLFLLLYLLFNKSRFGLHARATMQRREIASSIGVNVNKMNITIIVLASAIGGLGGSLYAPTMSISASYGGNFLMHAFVAMIIGGSNPLVGTFIAAMLLSVVETGLSLFFGSFIGRIGMLIVAIIVIRVMPGGISGMVERTAARLRR